MSGPITLLLFLVGDSVGAMQRLQCARSNHELMAACSATCTTVGHLHTPRSATAVSSALNALRISKHYQFE